MARRYVLTRIVSEHPVTEEQLGSALIATIRKGFGEIGLARIGPKLIRFDSGKSLAVIACTSGMIDELQAAIGLMSGCGEQPVASLVIQVSGTIKGLARRRRK